MIIEFKFYISLPITLLVNIHIKKRLNVRGTTHIYLHFEPKFKMSVYQADIFFFGKRVNMFSNLN